MRRTSVVCFKYNTPGYRTRFTSTMVNKLFMGLYRNWKGHPFELICVTDDPKGIMSDVQTRPMLPTFRNLRNPTSPTRPNCYPRLPLFDPSNPYGLQEYWLSIDLDAVITGDWSIFCEHTHDFVIYKIRGRYCGSLFGGRVGATPELFTDFDPQHSPVVTNGSGFRGSDQAWFEYKLGSDMPTWTADDGVYGWQDEIGYVPRARRKRPVLLTRPTVPNKPSRFGRQHGNIVIPTKAQKTVRCAPPSEASSPVRPHGIGVLPPNAKIVFFYGEPKAWDKQAQAQSPWILEHFR